MKKEFKKSFEGKEERSKRTDDKPRMDKEFKKRDDRPFKSAKTRGAEGDKPAGRKFPDRRKDDSDGSSGRSFDKKPFPKRQEEGGTPSFGEKRVRKTDSDSNREGKFERKPYKRREEGGEQSFGERKERKFGDNKFGKKPFEKREGGDREKRFDKKPFERREGGEGERGERSFDKKPFKRREDAGGERRFDGEKRERKFDKKPFERREGSDGEKRFGGERKFDKKPFKKREDAGEEKRFDGEKRERKFDKKPFDKNENRERTPRKRPEESEVKEKPQDNRKSIEEPMTLNKYIAHSGECSRRDAAEMVKQGKARVNGELILEPGHRVAPGDTVTLSGKKLTPQKNLVYLLLNKPKDFITTTDDPQDRKTVMDLVANSEVDRLYPVGRLDRNTTGLLLMTNDGALAHKLSHPSYQIRKVYHVTLDKKLTKADYEKIFKGIELEDGIAQVDEIAYLEERNEIGLEIHSGRNRIVRRIFESLGYAVEKLDRVSYAGLTKKNLPRGKWRFLDEKEIIFLKHFKN